MKDQQKEDERYERLRSAANRINQHHYHGVGSQYYLLDLKERTIKWAEVPHRFHISEENEEKAKEMTEMIFADPERYRLFLIDSGSTFGKTDMVAVFVVYPASERVKMIYKKEVNHQISGRLNPFLGFEIEGEEVVVKDRGVELRRLRIDSLK